MAKLPDWIQDCKDRGTELYARGLEKGGLLDVEEAVLWRTHGMDLIKKISQQAEQIKRLRKRSREIVVIRCSHCGGYQWALPEGATVCKCRLVDCEAAEAVTPPGKEGVK